MTAATTAAKPSIAKPRVDRDLVPIYLILGLAVLALPLVGSVPTWVTLTVAGAAMGMMIFVMASGLTLVFGLMDVINFGHGAFISIGAFVAVAVVPSFAGWMQADSVLLNVAAILPALLAAAAVGAGLGWVFERVIIRPVYGQHLKQILVTIGGLIIVEQLLLALWGPDQIPLPRPPALRGAVFLGDAAIEKYRLFAVGLGLLVFGGLYYVLRHTRVGLLVRAGVENGEMVEALGYRIRRIFVAVFAAGSALAALGGVMWALYQEQVTVHMGMQVMVLVFIAIIIGGLGSVGGCLAGSILLGLMANYTSFLTPKIALGSNILLMVGILLWRPQGLYPLARQ